jgi:hypothetical protein
MRSNSLFPAIEGVIKLEEDGEDNAEISLTTCILLRYKEYSTRSIEALSSSVIESSNNAANSPYRSASVIFLELLV